MKKILFASSAIVAVAFAGQASASEKIKLSVGGYMEQWAGIADQEDAFDDVNAFQSDTELYFSGSTTLDNGIEVGAKIELEGETSGDQIDEQFLYVQGSFGRVNLGEEDGPAGDMAVTAPAVGPVGVNDGDLANWVSVNAMPDTVWDDGDDPKITYYTPVLGGFRAGIAYTDSDDAENTNGNTENSTNGQLTTGGNEVVSIGLSYDADFDGVSLSLAAVGEKKREGHWVSVGTNVGFGNFTVGGSYGVKSDDYDRFDGQAKLYDDTVGYDIGVSYAMDAASVSLSYAHGDIYTGTASTAGNEIDTVDLGLAYTLGAGVTWKSSVFWFDDEGRAAGTADDNDGYGVVTGLKLDF
ncbi:porin [Thalassospira xiamenensis]|uniref:Outer membrane protein (Porin) n=1 Tax=Thalassospira xiamenensis TaxID=220697 RepID=A0A285T7S8_9PROT|nr:porin [Thalassospira xiamenensis]SOC17368.1 Outer membrane protein (porin) [Thalassospira xiamenensis]